MLASPLERDCLFQLNLILWACFPQPPSAPVTPVLRSLGYSIWAIELPLDASAFEISQLRATNPPISPNPVCDVVLYSDQSNVYVLIECKSDSFGPQSEQARQGRGLIAAGGNISARRPEANAGSHAELCYAVPGSACTAIDTTLLNLAAEVRHQGFSPCSTGPLGVHIKHDGAYLGANRPPIGKALVAQSLVPERRVLALEPGQDSRPLYVVPWLPSAPASVDHRIFREKVRQRLLSWLGKLSPPTEALYTFDDLLSDMSYGIYGKWRNRSSLKGELFLEVKKVLAMLFGGDERLRVRRSSLVVMLRTVNDQTALIDKLRSRALAAEEPVAQQLILEEFEE